MLFVVVILVLVVLLGGVVAMLLFAVKMCVPIYLRFVCPLVVHAAVIVGVVFSLDVVWLLRSLPLLSLFVA